MNIALYWDTNIFYSSSVAKNVSIDGSVSNMLSGNRNVCINETEY